MASSLASDKETFRLKFAIERTGIAVNSCSRGSKSRDSGWLSFNLQGRSHFSFLETRECECLQTHSLSLVKNFLPHKSLQSSKILQNYQGSNKLKKFFTALNCALKLIQSVAAFQELFSEHLYSRHVQK